MLYISTFLFLLIKVISGHYKNIKDNYHTTKPSNITVNILD